MKTSALFLAAVLVPAAVLAVPAVPASAVTNQYFINSGLGAYQYGYDWTFPEGHGAFQRESGNAAGHKQGSYGLKYADGTVRIVSYIADEAGFRVSISTNEPGTLSSSPADALFPSASGTVPGKCARTTQDVPARSVSSSDQDVTNRSGSARRRHCAECGSRRCGRRSDNARDPCQLPQSPTSSRKCRPFVAVRSCSRAWSDCSWIVVSFK
ncbi:hypothetical protein MRX96_004979 [Rhipicephalus microplus]